MLGPFPGMYPYLEDVSFWLGFHNSFIAKTLDALNAALPEGNTTYSEEREYVIYPSVNLYERYIEIRSRKPEQQVITLLEVLSPSNKAVGSSGREQYLNKQRSRLESGAHLLEIDLLRGGKHTVAVPYEIMAEIGKKDYLVSLNRSERRDTFQIWPFSLRDRLPRILVPLSAGGEDLTLDLQQIFDSAYEYSSGRRDADYQNPPPVPFTSEDEAWADQLLRAYKMRS